MLEIIYGRNAVYEALRAGRRRCTSVWIAEGVQQSGAIARILELAEKRSLAVRRVPRRQLDQLGDVNHQGVAAQVGIYPYAEVEDMLRLAQERKEMPLLLLLDCLQDPQNLGTLLRTAEVVGVHGVVIPRHRAAEVTPAVSHASAGAVEHLLVAQVTNLVRTIGELKEQGVWIVGLENLPEAQHYRQARLDMPLALVVGSEGQGLGRLVRENCDLHIHLPMRGKVDSLNASVAGSIALYEAWQQRARPQPR
ncbi:MAG: 23S rRNA (guanosine(2251)-2'-O)-methyltransferase RlmB [Chloroflexi bacterium]|nr:23S rRNA (guanosine(2251)-2'-O)-methyltransferase RlmB [Chloroflexota bacterium]